MDKSKKLVERFKIKEREVPLKIAYLEFYYKLNEKDKIDELLKEMRSLMRKREERLYEPEYYLFLGKREWEKRRIRASMGHLETALEKAEEIGKIELVWRIYHLLAKINLSLKNIEKSYTYFDRARETLVKLAGNIEEASLRQSYLDDQEKRELLSDMKVLAETATHEVMVMA